MSTYLHWNINLRQIFHRPIDDTLDIILAQKLRNRLHLLKLSILVRHQTILRKVIGEYIGDALAELLLLLGQIGSADDADGDFLGEGLHEVHHFLRDFPPRDGEGAIDVKEGDDTGVLGCHYCLFGMRYDENYEGTAVGVKSDKDNY